MAALVAAVASLIAPGAAGAHADLDSASPVPNSVVTSVVTEVVLTFSEPVVLFGDGVTVSNGPEVIRSTPSIAGTTVTAKLATPIGAGTYDVTWNIESADGHRLTQSYPFTIAAGVVAPVTAPGTLPETTTTSSTPGASTSAPTTRPADVTTTTTIPAKKASGTRAPNWVLYAVPAALLVGLAAAIGGIIRVVRNRRA